MKSPEITHEPNYQPLFNQIFDSQNQINRYDHYLIYAYKKTLYIINSQAGQKFKAIVQPKKVCSLFQDFSDLEQLIIQSHIQFKDHALFCEFNFCETRKSIKIEFKSIQFNLEEQNKLMREKLKLLTQDLRSRIEVKQMMDIRLEQLLQFKKTVTKNYRQWQQTHCGVCGKQVKSFAKKVKGAMACSEICSSTILATSKWKSIFDIGI